MAHYDSEEDGEKKMDFARFLSTGELSDISVTVDSKVFQLHKFPLYTKSDFFRALARSSTPADKDHVTLTDFPGGPATFELITNYCYNVRIKLTPENVCQLRCAAEFLQMTTGPGNLAGAADRVLESTLVSAALERRLDAVVFLVLQCRQLGAIAEQAGVIEKCVKAIVDSWLSTPTFTRSYSANQPIVDKEILIKLTTFPLNWFTDLLQVARDKFVSASVSAALIELYISNALDLDEGQGGRQDEKKGQGQTPGDRLERKPPATRGKNVQEEKGKREERKGKEEEEKEEQEKEENEEEEEEAQEEDEEEEEEKVANGENLEGDRRNKEEQISPIESARDHEEEEEEKEEKEKEEEEEEEQDEEQEEEEEEEEEDDEVESIREQHPDKVLTAAAIGDEDISAILDTLLCEFPEAVAVLSGIVTPKWVIAVLAKATELDLRSKDVLVQMVARLLSRFTDEDLSQLTPDVFVLVLKETCGESRENTEVEIPPNQICRTVDSYLKGISSQGALNHDVFRQIVEAVPEKYRANEDTFFHVLEKLLQSETNDLSEAERESLLDSVDYSRLTDSALQAAFDSKLVPVHHIAMAALRLCSQLRAELTAAKAVVEQQEQELFKRRGGYGSGRSRWTTTGGTGSRRTDDGTDGADRSVRRVDSNRESLPSSSYRPAASTRSRSRSYGTGTGTTATTGSHHLSGNSSYYHHNTNPGNPYIPTLATELELRLALSCLGDDQLDELRYGNSSSLTHHPLITSSSAGGGMVHDIHSAYDDFDSNFGYYRSIPSTQSYSRKYYSSKHSSH